MKTSKLLITSLLAAAAMSAVPAWADIYTWVGNNSNNAHDGGWATTTITDGNVTYTAFNTEPGGSWRTHLNGDEYNTLRFIASESTISVGGTSYTVSESNKSPEVSFSAGGTAGIDNPGLRIGGLIVETGATEFSIAQNSGSTRYFGLGNGTDTFTGTIDEDFSMTAAGFLLKGTQNWTIASGKTMTFRTGTTKISAGAVVNISGGGAVSAVKLSGSGRVVLSGASSLTLSAEDGFNTGWTGTVAITGNGTLSLNQLRGSGCIELGGNATLSITNSTKFNTNWTGTIKLKDFSKTSAFALDLNNYGKSGSDIVLDGVSGSNFYFAAGSNNALAIAANVEIGAGGLTLNNGYSNTVYTFAGDISGSGNWTHSGTRGTGTNTATQQYVFTGDVSGYSGTMNLANASLVTFGNGGDGVTGEGISVSGTGTITMANAGARVTYNYGNDVAASTTLEGGMGVAKQGVGSLTLTGTNTYSGGTTVEAGTLIAGSTSAFGSGALTVNAGAEVSANGYAVGLGAGNVTINGAYVVTANGLLATNGTITFGDVGTLDVSGVDAGTYTIFGGTGTVSGLTQDKLYKASGRDVVAFADDNKSFTLTKGSVYDLTWTSAAGTWEASTTWQNNTQGGETDPTFADGDTVTFAASETAAKEISVVGAKDAQAVNVTGGDYAFSAGEGGSLSVRGALTVSSGASLTLSDGVLGTVAGGIVLDGRTAMLKLVDAGLPGLTNIVSGSGKVVLERVSTQIAEPTISTANVLTGAISVEKIGNTKVSITAAQSYTGGTTITAGNIGVGHNEALGTGTITLNGSNAQITSHAAGLNFDNAVTIGENGGIVHTQAFTMTLSGQIAGSGTLTKQGTGTLVLTNPTASTVSGSGGIVIEAGTLYLSGSGNHFGVSKDITLKNGTFLKWNDASQSSDASYQYELSGALAVEGNTTITGATNYAKEVALLGNLSGSGTLTYYRGNGDSGSGNFNSNGRLIIAGTDNSGFTGTIVVGGQTTAVSQGLDLNADLANGTISLQGGSGDAAYMRVLKSATIKGLNGNANSSVGIGNVLQDGEVGAYTLTVGEGNFAGTIEDNGEARKYGLTTSTKVTGAVLSIVKKTAGTLTLSGDNTFTGGVTIEQGVLVAGHANALGTTAGTTTVNSGGVLKVAVDGGVTAGTVTLNGGARLAIDLTAYSNVEEGTALTIISSSAISFNSQEFSPDLMENTFFDLANSDLGSWSSHLREWSYDTANGLQLTLTIPEPSVFGLLAGLGALALAGTRRRRKKA